MAAIVQQVTALGLPQAEAVAATNAAVKATGLRTAIVQLGENTIVSSILPGASRPVLAVTPAGKVFHATADLAVEGGKFVVKNLSGL
jgi:hypothetical protein